LFFQAEDGIRDKLVTGVQTCALPIFEDRSSADHGDRLLHAGWFQLEVEGQLLTQHERHRRVLDRREARALDPDGIRRRLQRSDQIGRASCRERVWSLVEAERGPMTVS